MNTTFVYFFIFAIFLLLAIFLQIKYRFLCNSASVASGQQSYSFARTQLAWWTFLILISFISVVFLSGKIPTLDQSTLILLGIGSLTTISARVIDINDTQNYNQATAAASAPDSTSPQPAPLVQSNPKQNFLIDILSDKNGVSVHRFQAFMFNLVFGLWFIYQTLVNLKNISTYDLQPAIDAAIPIFSQNNLILLGISAGVYTSLKAAENK